MQCHYYIITAGYYIMVTIHTVCHVAGSSACSHRAQSDTCSLLSNIWLFLLLLQTVWKVWREGIPLQNEASDCQMCGSFDYHSPDKCISPVNFC